MSPTTPRPRPPSLPTPRLRLLIRRFPPIVGGMERQCAAICARLAAGGIDVEVWTRRLPADIAIAPTSERRDGYTVHRLRPGGFGRWGEYVGLPAMVARLVLDRHRPDVVAVFGGGWLAIAAGVASRVTKRPWMFRPATAGDVTRFVDPASRPAGSRIGRAFARFSPPSAWRLRVLRAADAVVAVSAEIERELADWSFEPARIVAIPNGVDSQRFRPADAPGRAAARAALGLGGDASTPVVLFMGRLVARKGPLDLVAAWRSLATTESAGSAIDATARPGGRAPEACLVIAGSGAGHVDSVEADLRGAVARAREMPDREMPDNGADPSSDIGPSDDAGPGSATIQLVGPVDDPGPWLAAADVFALPSHAEGLSNALLEAMACGLAIVASDIEPNRQALGDEAAWYHRPGDASDLARALGAALADPVERARRGAAARRRAEAQFSLDAAAIRYGDAIARVAGRHVGAWLDR